MGVITPNGDMFLLHVNIDPANQLWFEDKASQETFFQSRSVVGLSPTDYTFIQKDNYVRVDKNADQLYNANYLMYRNTAHSNKWFYAYIKDITWLSDHSSAIKFETDVYQTWRFALRFRESLIERETVPSDSIGEHLLDEGLQLGDYVQSGNGITAGLGKLSICVATTVKSVTPGSIPGFNFNREVEKGMAINGVYSGSAIIAFDFTPGGVEALNNWLESITEAGASEAIVAIYMCPTNAVNQLGVPDHLIADNYGKVFGNTFSGYMREISMRDRPLEIDGYTPRCNKLLSPPFVELYVQNGNGSATTYDINEFSEGVKFDVWGNTNPMPQFKLVPIGYKNSSFPGPENYQTSSNVDEALTLQNFPMCSYGIDGYKAWLAQNGTSTTVGIIGSAAAAAGSVALAAGTGGASVGLSSIMAISSVSNATQLLAKSGEARLQPQQAQNNANSGSVNTTMEANDFYISYQTIRKEWATMIDMYLHMYGYKINQVKYPSFGCRERWYYCKMTNPNIHGAIPVPDLNKIKEMFMNGVTLWNSHTLIGLYNIDNTIKANYTPPTPPPPFDPSNPSPY